jgi:nucleoside-diphosphate-sugar epimerase
LEKFNKFLILGSSGLIGRHLKLYLEKIGKEVIDFDIENDKKQDLRISDNDYLLECIIKVDFVFFLGFDVGGAKFLTNLDKKEDFLFNNTAIILHTFSLLSKVRKPFIFASTYLVNDLRNNYSFLKSLGERYTNLLNGLNVRLWNIYGFEIVSERSHLIPDLINQAYRYGIIELLTDGKEKKQFLHVEDCCEALYEIALRYDQLVIYNYVDLSSFSWTSVYKVAKIISEYFSCRIIRSNIVSNLSPKVEPQKTVLEFWHPKINLNEGIFNLKNIYEESVNNGC